MNWQPTCRHPDEQLQRYSTVRNSSPPTTTPATCFESYEITARSLFDTWLSRIHLLRAMAEPIPPRVEPTPFPTQWDYTLTSNFSHDGVSAEWAPGAPHAWGSEGLTIPIDNEPLRISLSADDAFIAVICKHSVEILENDGSGTKRLSLPSMPQDWTVNHAEWHEKASSRESSLREHQLLVCFASPAVPGLAYKDAVTRVYSLDTYTWTMVPDPTLIFLCFPWLARSRHMLNTTGERLLVLSRAQEGEQSTPSMRSQSGQIEVWSMTQHVRSCTLPAESQGTRWLGFSPDGSVIGVASTRNLRLFDASSGALKSTMETLAGQINGVAFSPDGGKIACSGAKPSVEIFDIDGLHLHSIPFQPANRSLAWSPDGSKLAYSAQGGFLQVLDWASRSSVQAWHLEYPGIRPSPLNEPTDLQFVDEGCKLLFATGMEGGIEVYSFTDNRKQRYEPGTDSGFVLGTKKSSAVWSTTQRKVLSLDGDGYLRFWEC